MPRKKPQPVTVIVLNVEAGELTDAQVDALFQVPQVAKYLESEVEFTKDRRSAIWNATCVTNEDGKLEVRDFDCRNWAYRWDDKKGTWEKIRR